MKSKRQGGTKPRSHCDFSNLATNTELLLSRHRNRRKHNRPSCLAKFPTLRNSSKSAAARMLPVRRTMRTKRRHILTKINSGTDKEEQGSTADQVQGSLPPLPIHPRPQGQRQGREAQAVASPRYDDHADVPPPSNPTLSSTRHLRDAEEERKGQASCQVIELSKEQDMRRR